MSCRVIMVNLRRRIVVWSHLSAEAEHRERCQYSVSRLQSHVFIVQRQLPYLPNLGMRSTNVTLRVTSACGLRFSNYVEPYSLRRRGGWGIFLCFFFFFFKPTFNNNKNVYFPDCEVSRVNGMWLQIQVHYLRKHSFAQCSKPHFHFFVNVPMHLQETPFNLL